MCLSPITIPTQTKYISLAHRDPFLMQVPCGHCAECSTTLSNQWYYRSWYEWQELSFAGGYVLFDTLTYNDKYLPHLSDTWTFLQKNEDFPCFNYQHIRKFLQLLRTRLIRAGYSKNAFRYFLCSEYGSSEYYNFRGCLRKAQHRPHYHLLLYVYDTRIEPVYLSKLIASIWHYGRTDGVPYKGTKYLFDKRVFMSDCSLVTRLYTCKYVSKYVQKSCEFDKQIRVRVVKVMQRLAAYADPVTPDDWLEKEEAHRERLKLLRLVNQFHRQSQHFGEAALGDIDLNQLFKDGCLYMPDSKGIRIPIPFPTYYKRKIFYDLIEFNGSRYWVLNELGQQFKAVRYPENKQRLIDRYACVIQQNRLGFDAIELANYVLDERGRIIADNPQSTLIERINEIDLFNYSTCSDKLQFGCRGLSADWLGDSQQGYLKQVFTNRISLQHFVEKCVYFDDRLEKQLDKLLSCMCETNKGKQQFFEFKQRMTNLFKHSFPLIM